MVRIKICGVSNPEDAVLAAEAGSDAVGLNFYPQSPRYVDMNRATAIVRALPPFTAAVGVFVDTPFAAVLDVAAKLGLRGIQTYDADPPIADPFPFAHLPAFRVRDESTIQVVRRYLDSARAAGKMPAAILVDSYSDSVIGGSGNTAPWQLLEGIDLGCRLILAGGLTPENVGEAITRVRPWGIDVASGVESAPGRKDRNRLRRFVQATREAEDRLRANLDRDLG